MFARYAVCESTSCDSRIGNGELAVGEIFFFRFLFHSFCFLMADWKQFEAVNNWRIVLGSVEFLVPSDFAINIDLLFFAIYVFSKIQLSIIIVRFFHCEILLRLE